MTNSRTEILIVGAGPTGLALANLLAIHHIPFLIIDKNSERSNKSKALGVQAGTLEAISYRLGKDLTEKLISAGNKVQNAYFNFYEHAPVHLNLKLIPSSYNFVLILPQDQTERLLEENLQQQGSKVQRESELTSLVQNTDTVTATLKTKTGTEETIEAAFVVGCDGAGSTVRNLLQLPFAGGEYAGNFILGDVEFDDPDAKNALEMFISDKGALAYFPIKAKGYGRFILIPQGVPPANTREISLSEFSNILNELSPKPIRITEAPWLSRFTIHHRMVDHMSKGRVFVAGDAAHIHSPAGGQGMNTGIQDAFNLGLKLVQVLSGKANLASLDLYEKQRHPIARRILRSTDLASRYILLSNSRSVRFIKKHLLPRLLSMQWVQKKLAAAISEVAIARNEINKSN